MSYRKTVFALLLAGAALPAAFADSGFKPVAGDRGFEVHSEASGTNTRADVRAQLKDSRQNSLVGDINSLGGRGDAGYIAPKHGYAFEGGKVIHADNISHGAQKLVTVLDVAYSNSLAGRGDHGYPLPQHFDSVKSGRAIYGNDLSQSTQKSGTAPDVVERNLHRGG